MSGMSIAAMIRLAYTPKRGFTNLSTEIRSAPDWMNTDLYDLDARVAPDDQATWQKAQNGVDSELAHRALLTALKDRSQLAVHITSDSRSCLDLVVSPHGAKLQPAAPGPPKIVLGKTVGRGQGIEIFAQSDARQFVHVSMSELAQRLTILADGQIFVQDKTGLTGRYDFTLPWYQDPQIVGLDRMPLTGTGLMLKPDKMPIIVINIDHIEKPDAN